MRGPCSRLCLDKGEETLARIVVVNAEAVLHGDGDGHGLAHGGEAVGDQLGLAHQAGAERAGLHALRRAADIEIDLAIAVSGADPRSLRQLVRLGAAELQGDGLLDVIEAKQTIAVAVDDGVSGDHLRVEQRMARQMAMESPAIPVRPVHHRRDGEGVRRNFHRVVEKPALDGKSCCLRPQRASIVKRARQSLKRMLGLSTADGDAGSKSCS